MDRVFLDANVLFSAAYGSPGLAKLWSLPQEGRVILLTSGYALEEARRNLSSKEHLERLELLACQITIVPEVDPGITCPIKLHDKDRPIFLAALQARATHLIIGDLRDFGAYLGKTAAGVLICKPSDYLATRNGAG